MLVLRVMGVGEELLINLTTVCQCQCGDTQPYADHCSGGHGKLTCGVCRYSGKWVRRIVGSVKRSGYGATGIERRVSHKN